MHVICQDFPAAVTLTAPATSRVWIALSVLRGLCRLLSPYSRRRPCEADYLPHSSAESTWSTQGLGLFRTCVFLYFSHSFFFFFLISSLFLNIIQQIFIAYLGVRRFIKWYVSTKEETVYAPRALGLWFNSCSERQETFLYPILDSGAITLHSSFLPTPITQNSRTLHKHFA